MPTAKFEAYDAAGNVQFTTDRRAMRVLAVTDTHPSDTSYTDPEIIPGAVIPGPTKGTVTVGSGSISYSGAGAGSVKPSTIMY